MEVIGTNFLSGLQAESLKNLEGIKKIQNTPPTALVRNIAFTGMAVGGLLLAGMLFMQVIAGVVALGVSVVALGSLFYGLRFLKHADPLIKQKMNNFIIAKRIEEARTHKLETLTNLVLSSAERLDHGRKALNKMGGYVGRSKSKLAQSNPTSSTYQTKLKMVEQIEAVYNQMIQSSASAENSHRQLEERVIEFKEMHEFSSIINDAMKFATNNQELNLEKMLGYEAFMQIDSDFHEAMATIENSARNFNEDE